MFPILDENCFLERYDTDKDDISPALLSSLYAHAIIYWRNSQYLRADLKDGKSWADLRPTLVEQRYPDLRYVWGQANLALTSEMHAQFGMSTIVAILLNLSGRPLTSMIRNRMFLSSAISIAHTLSLNRNSTGWEISKEESRMRTRFWWAIVINDKWQVKSIDPSAEC